MEFFETFRKLPGRNPLTRAAKLLARFSQQIEELKATHADAIAALRAETLNLANYTKSDHRQLSKATRELQEQSFAYAFKAAKLEPPAPEGQLRRVLDAQNLKMVDIGGRGGPLPSFRHAAPFTDLFTIDPDPQAAKQLESEPSVKLWRSAKIVPEAIGPETGTVKLNVTRDPGLSSVLKPNFPVIERYFSREGWEVVKELEVPCLTLDAAASKYGFTDAAMLKLDVQGYELEILKSGPELLKQVDAVYVELEFLPFYEGQPLFGDIDSFLRERGFALIDLKRSFFRRTNRVPASYSKRELVWSHGLYLRVGDPLLENLTEAQARRRFAVYTALEEFDLAVSVLEDKRLETLFEADFGKDLLRSLRDHAFAVGETYFRTSPETRKVSLYPEAYTDRYWER